MPKKAVIKPMSDNDVVEQKGTVKSDMTRSVKVNDTMQNLTVTRSLNHKKGAFEILVKWNMNAITGDDVVDSATLDSFCRMMMSQRNKCITWRDEWKRSNDNPEDPDQIGMGFADED